MKTIDFASLTASGGVFRSAELALPLPFRQRRYYRHGWQSWSLAAWTDPLPMPVQKPAILRPLQIDPGYAVEREPGGSWLGAAEMADGRVAILGALATDARVRLTGSSLVGTSGNGAIEWLAAAGSEEEVFRAYAEALRGRFGARLAEAQPRVWCSWYSLYAAIDEAILHETFDLLGDLPFDVLQVDDGWQRCVGDWEPNAKFPSGMGALAKRIGSTGRRAGLWLAPFLAVRSSALYRDHPDWFLRGEDGRHVSAGFNWGEQLYALDTSNPAVGEWLTALLRRVRGWGFDYLKLDFLYAAALPGLRRDGKPREASYREALRLLRRAMGEDAYFIACGSPILPALGICDALRIGPDVDGVWENHLNESLFYNFTTPGGRNALRTAVHRLWLAPAVRVDPDVVYFAAKGNRLSEEQKALLRDLALVSGFKASSDLPHWLDEGQRRLLRDFLESSPPVRRCGSYAYEIDGRTVDFASAVSLPPPPRGLRALQASLLGGIAGVPFFIRTYMERSAHEMRKRRAAL